MQSVNSRRAETTEHRFRHYPQCPVKLHVTVYAAYRTGMRASPFCTTSAESSFDQILLNTLVRGPQVVAFVLPTPGGRVPVTE